MFKKHPFVFTALVIVILLGVYTCSACATSGTGADAWTQAIALQIADETLLTRAQDTCSQKEVVSLITSVHNLRCDQPSQFLTDMMNKASEKPASRYWLAQAIYYSAMETYFDEPYKNYDAWMSYCDRTDPGFGFPDAGAIGIRQNDQTIGEGGIWDLCTDLSDIEYPADRSKGAYREDFGNLFVANYCLWLFDRTDGSKVLGLDDAGRFLPQKKLTVDDALKAAMHFYRSFEASPEMVPYSQIVGYDRSIITDELLAKQSNLPEASCQQLPAQWHGVLMFDMGRVTMQSLDVHTDKVICEGDIDLLQQAGFNFVGLGFDFSLFQGPTPSEGMINEARLKELDQVIAWCMERDIHVDLRCLGVGGCNIKTDFGEWMNRNHDIPNSKDEKDVTEFAELWAVLARRYQDIPNRYISFNLMVEPEINTEKQYAAFFTPVVEAIRKVTPDRCVIADIHSSGLTGVSMAKLGVALSYHLYEPRMFCALNDLPEDHIDDEEYLHSITWPYQSSNGKVYDAKKAMDVKIDHSISANGLLKTAKKYNVGFMIGEFGIFGEHSGQISRYRYSDETFRGYLNDMTSTFAEKGIAWCYGVCQGNTGLVADYPAVETEEYQKADGTTVYIGTKVMGWFQKINGVQ